MCIMLSTEKNRRIVFIACLVMFVVFTIVNSLVSYHKTKSAVGEMEAKAYEYLQLQHSYKRQADSASIERARMAFKLLELESQLDANYKYIDEFERRNNEDIINLQNKYQNESKYIPNTSSSEQYRVLSEYQYEPY